MSEEQKSGRRMVKRIRPVRRPGAGQDAGETQGLKEEIAMLREMNRWMAEDLEEGCQPAQRIRVLETLGKSYTRLATLLKTEHMLGGNDVVQSALNQALKELMQEMTEENRKL